MKVFPASHGCGQIGHGILQSVSFREEFCPSRHGLKYNIHWTYKKLQNKKQISNLHCSLGNANMLLWWLRYLQHTLQLRYLPFHLLTKGPVPFLSNNWHPPAPEKCQQWCSGLTEQPFLLNDTARSRISIQQKQLHYLWLICLAS